MVNQVLIYKRTSSIRLGSYKILYFTVSHKIPVNFSKNYVNQEYDNLSLGSWKLNPYLSFTVSALVELAGYVVVHLILDRIGRKKPYCLFAVLFGIVALLAIPVQKYMTKDSTGLSLEMESFLSECNFVFEKYFSTSGLDEYYQRCIEISRVSILRYHLHLC